MTNDLREADRLQQLRDLDLLDTMPEEEYNQLVRLASSICGTPISLVSLVDEDRQWFKARVGMAAAETPRNVSFCAHAIRTPNLFVVNDATQDRRFSENALVTGNPGVRFYAGLPLQAPGGALVGTLCVIDTVPRTLSESQIDALTILGAQVQARIALRDRERALEKALAEKCDLAAALELANEELDRLATTDSLTGLSNRREFDERAAIEFSVARRKKRSLALLVLDVDNFKRRNDTFGHAAGDEALRKIAKVIRKNVRMGDLAARIGGEEFAHLLTDCDLHSAEILARRTLNQIRAIVADHSALTVSIGVVALNPAMETPEEMLAFADEAMYEAKRAGKDRFVVHASSNKPTLVMKPLNEAKQIA